MQFDFSLSNSKIEKTDLLNRAQDLKEYIYYLECVVEKKTYDCPESSLLLSTDEGLRRNARAAVQKYSSPLPQTILVIGIGGSSLGAKAVYEALRGFDDLLGMGGPRILFLESCDPEFINKALQYVKKITRSAREVCVNVISKSGGTTETIVNFEVVYKQLSRSFSDIDKQVVITTNKNSLLWEYAALRNMQTLEIPKPVGGRYSVFSPVGLFPLGLAQIDIEALCAGAQSIRALCLSQNPMENPALFSAIFIYYHLLKGKHIHDLFLFHKELESLGKWYRQLMGESIGKDDRGVTPTVSVGSDDLHSVVQLYLGGPRDKSTSFVFAPAKETTIIPSKTQTQTVKHIEGKKIEEIQRAIEMGTVQSYINQEIPFLRIDLESLSEFEIGAFMQFKMIEMMFLAQLLKVNCFDQPHVELYKEETRRILAQSC